MAITVIPNQAVNLTLIQEGGDCACSKKNFCQKINKFDIQKFQIKSPDIIVNGGFANGIDDWVIRETLGVTLVVSNETVEGDCDGSITVTATGGDSSYEYSIDGINFQVSNLFDDLCVGCYNIIVRDGVDNLGFANGCIDTNVDCTLYNEPDLFDLLTLDLSKISNCELNDVL